MGDWRDILQAALERSSAARTAAAPPPAQQPVASGMSQKEMDDLEKQYRRGETPTLANEAQDFASGVVSGVASPVPDLLYAVGAKETSDKVRNVTENIVPPSNPYRETLGGATGQFVGGVLPFMAAGAGEIAALPKWARMAALGGGQGFGSGRREADLSGATTTQSVLAGLGQGVIGAAQAIPVGALQRAAEQPFLKSLPAVMGQNVGYATGGTVASNLLKKATYKPEQDIGEGVGQAALGATLGTPLIHGAAHMNRPEDITLSDAEKRTPVKTTNPEFTKPDDPYIPFEGLSPTAQKALEATKNDMLKGVSFRVRGPVDSREAGQSRLGAANNNEVLYVEGKGSKALPAQGAYYFDPETGKSVTLLDASLSNSEKGRGVFWHEFVHWLQQVHPDVHKSLLEHFGLTPETAKLGEENKARTRVGQSEGVPTALLTDEMVKNEGVNYQAEDLAQHLDAAFQSPDELQKLLKNPRTPWEKMKDAFIPLLQGMGLAKDAQTSAEKLAPFAEKATNALRISDAFRQVMKTEGEVPQYKPAETPETVYMKGGAVEKPAKPAKVKVATDVPATEEPASFEIGSTVTGKDGTVWTITKKTEKVARLQHEDGRSKFVHLTVLPRDFTAGGEVAPKVEPSAEEVDAAMRTPLPEEKPEEPQSQTVQETDSETPPAAVQAPEQSASEKQAAQAEQAAKEAALPEDDATAVKAAIRGYHEGKLDEPSLQASEAVASKVLSHIRENAPRTGGWIEEDQLIHDLFGGEQHPDQPENPEGADEPTARIPLSPKQIDDLRPQLRSSAIAPLVKAGILRAYQKTVTDANGDKRTLRRYGTEESVNKKAEGWTRMRSGSVEAKKAKAAKLAPEATAAEQEEALRGAEEESAIKRQVELIERVKKNLEAASGAAEGEFFLTKPMKEGQRRVYPEKLSAADEAKLVAQDGGEDAVPTKFWTQQNVDKAMRIFTDSVMDPTHPATPEQVEQKLKEFGIFFYSKAWHGTPHTWAPEEGAPFGRPKNDKIGSGEGAQSFGWGHYFASKKEIAEHYKNKLSESFGVKSIGGQEAEAWFENRRRLAAWKENSKERIEGVNRARSILLFYRGDIDRSLRDASANADKMRRDLGANSNEAYIYDLAHEVIRMAESDGVQPDIRGGALYEVELKPREDEYLHWDLPISTQTPHVQEALAKAIPEMAKAVMEAGADVPPRPEWMKGEIMDRLHALFADLHGNRMKTGADLVNMLGKVLPDRAVSDLLLKAGIRGTKYLDASSRGQGGGEVSSNYVIFEPSDVETIARYSRAKNLAYEGERFAIEEETRAQMLHRMLVDEYSHPRRVMRNVLAQGGHMDEKSDFDTRLTQQPGRARDRMDIIDRDFKQPILETARKANIKIEGWDDADPTKNITAGAYLYALHAEDRNAEIMRRFPKKKFDQELNPGSGMSKSLAGSIIAAAHEGPKADAYRELGRLNRELQNHRLDQEVAYGRLTQHDADIWREQMGPNYVPLRTLGDRNPISRAAFKARGRSTLADELVAHSLKQAYDTVVNGEKNLVRVALGNFVLQNKDPLLWRVFTDAEKIPLKHIDDAIPYYRNGKKRWIVFTDPRISRSIMRQGVYKADVVTKTIGKWSQIYSRLNTAWNPEFLVPNLMRDMQDAGLNLSSEGKFNLAKEIPKNAWKSSRAMWRVLRDPHAKGAMEDMARRFKAAGGETGWVFSEDVEVLSKKLHKEVSRNDLATLDPRRAGQVIKKIGGFLDRANGALENGTRLAVFKAAVEHGMSDAQAAKLAKGVTVDFNRRGELTPLLNALYTFFNANVQGTVRTFSGFHKSPAKMAFAAALIAGAASLANLNRFLADQDDDGKSFWDKKSDWEKTRNLVIMLPGMKGRSIDIPLPWGWGLFAVLGTKLDAIAHGQQTKGEFLGGMASASIDAFNPLGSTPPLNTPAGLLQLATPSIGRPLAEIATNKDFAGRPVAPAEDPFEHPPKPNSERFFSTVSPSALAMARYLNELSGGNIVKPGKIDMSPEWLELMAGQVLGGLGMFGLKTVRTAESIMKGEAPSLDNIPALRRFTRGVDVERQVKTDFYDLLNKTAVAEKEVKQLGDQEAAASPEYIRRAIVDQAQRRITGLKRQMAKSKDPAQQARLEAMIQATMKKATVSFAGSGPR